jgi:hypothetical protein
MSSVDQHTIGSPREADPATFSNPIRAKECFSVENQLDSPNENPVEKLIKPDLIAPTSLVNQSLILSSPSRELGKIVSPDEPQASSQARKSVGEATV